MKISNGIPPAYTHQVLPSARLAHNNTAQSVQPTAGSDRVEISSQGQEIVRSIDAIQKLPTVDHQKVAKIKAMIEDGTYRIDSGKIASNMVDEALLADL